MTYLRLFIVALLLVCLSTLVWGEEYYSGELVYINSDHRLEGDIDHHTDKWLHEHNLSTSAAVFPDAERMRRLGAIIAKGQSTDLNYIEYGLFVDPNGKIVGHSDTTQIEKPEGTPDLHSVIHVRRDSIAVYGLIGAKIWRIRGGVGAYAMFSQADVHNWIVEETGEVISHSDQINEFSTGLVLKISADITENIFMSCTGFRRVDNMDTIGTGNVIACGAGYRF